MQTEEMEASCSRTLTAGNFSKEEELSFQISSFNEAMAQIRELEERAMEELKRIISNGQAGLSLLR